MGVKEMYPLDFEEFITCVGINENVISSLKDAWAKRIPVDGFLHNKMIAYTYIEKGKFAYD